MESLEQRNHYRISDNYVLHRTFQNLFQTIRRLRCKSTIQTLRGDRHAQARSRLCQLFVGCLGMIPPAEDQGRTNFAPVNLDCRCTKRVARAAWSATIVRTVWKVWQSCDTLVIGSL